MTSLKRNFLVILIVSIIILLNGCKKDDSNPTASGDELVGTWVLTKIIVTAPQGKINMTPQEAGLTMTVSLKSDRTYQQTQTTTQEGQTFENGTWSVSNGTLTAKATSGNTQSFPYRIIGNTLQLDTATTDPSTGALLPMTLEFTKQ